MYTKTRTDQNLAGTDQNPPGTDQNLAGTDQNPLGTDQNLEGTDQEPSRTHVRIFFSFSLFV